MDPIAQALAEIRAADQAAHDPIAQALAEIRSTNQASHDPIARLLQRFGPALKLPFQLRRLSPLSSPPLLPRARLILCSHRSRHL